MREAAADACNRPRSSASRAVSVTLLPAIIGLESMGVPSPGETALVAAAVLASQGHLKIWLVILIGACSAIVGDNIGYLLGRKLGREVLEPRTVPRAARDA